VRGGAQAAQGAVGGVGDGQGGRPEQADAFTSAREGDSRHLGAPVSSSGEIISPGTSQRRSSVPTEHQQSRPDPPATVKLRKQVEDLKRKIEWAADLEEEEKRRKAAEEGKKNISEEQEQEKKDLEVEIKELTKTFNSFNFEKRLAVHILTLKEEIKFPEPDGLLLTADYKEPFTEQLRRIEEAELESLGEFILQEYRKRVGKAEATRLTPWRKSKRSSTFLDIENQLVPTLPESYQEIKRLLLIEGQPVLKKALDVWESKRENHVNYIDRTKSNVAEVKNEIYQLIGFFSVFQGVLLTAVAQASQLHCPTSWIPISLSLFASVVTIAGVIQKLGQIKDLHNIVHYVQQSQKVWHLFSEILLTTKFLAAY
jgi:hypothetical protein